VPPDERPAAALTPPPGAFVLSRIRRSPVLRACGVLAFVEYGALTVWAIFGKSSATGPSRVGVWFPMAGWLALCSLGSWFFLFLWYPFLQSLQNQEERGDGSTPWVGRVLEIFAIGCVAVVHLMLALILVSAVGR
jgi:hypothetical protein